METSQLSGTGKKLFKLIEFDNQEKLLYEIRKHPFGLAIIYSIGIFVSLSVAAAAFGLMYLLRNDILLSGSGVNLSDNGGDGFRTAIIVGATFISLFALLFTFIGAHLYKSNVVLVTSDKVTQVLYRHIFDRKISQLSIGDVQDVTVNQVGIFSRIFNFGTLIIETAGEQQNYTFTYVPNPYEASKAIVASHEENLKLHGN